jgi:hypothetical protein
LPLWQLTQTVTTNTFVNYDLAAIVPAVAPAYGVVPPLGRMILSEIDFQIDLLAVQNAAAADIFGQAFIGLGLYVSTANAAGVFSTQDPLSAADLCRENWIQHEHWNETFIPRTSLTTFESIRRKIRLKAPVSIGEGKALRVTLSYLGPAVSNLLHVVSARAKITRVS